MLLEITFYIMALLALVFFLLIVLYIIYDPRGIVFLGDLIPEQHFNIFVRVFVIIYHVHVNFMLLFASLLFGYGVILYAFYVTPILIRELRIGRGNYKMSDNLRRSENIRHVFRSIQILQANALCSLGLFALVANASIMMTSLYVNFVLIRYWEMLEMLSSTQLLIAAGVLMGFWTFVLELGRLLFVHGNKVLGSWKGDKWGSPKENKLMKKFQRSCKPIIFCYGKQFVIGRANVLGFFRGVSRGMFRALLMTKT
ncbi:unnamed protein product [Orchesella dallaii]|uniref:Uncharacterized protein n=1 Tax=Orchesella dallaii TaxID=48710 RepID=A0ABP1R9I8_9HEXA